MMINNLDETSGKLHDYTDRHKDWRNIVVNQLSITNNVLLTLSAGVFIFSIEKHMDIFKKLTFNIHDISWEYTSYMLSITCLMFSIMFGIFVLFSRLYDFRISRHLALTRKRAYAEAGEITFSDYEFGKNTFKDRWIALWRVIFSRLEFVKKADKGEKRITKFHNLRRFSHILGEASWIWTKVQVLMFFAGVVCYLAFLFLRP